MSRPQTMRTDGLDTPHPSRFSPDRADFQACMEAHRSAVATGRPGYLDPGSGLYVMTAANLAEQGSCCDRGCRHCPYLGGPIESEPSSPRHEENEEHQ